MPPDSSALRSLSDCWPAVSAWADKVCRVIEGLPLESAAAAAGVEECLIGISEVLSTMLTAAQKYRAEGKLMQYAKSSQCDSALKKGEADVRHLLQLLSRQNLCVQSTANKLQYIVIVSCCMVYELSDIEYG